MVTKDTSNEQDPGIYLSDLPGLKRAWNKAIKNDEPTFLYKGVTVSTDYAEHVIEYLESLKSK